MPLRTIWCDNFGDRHVRNIFVVRFAHKKTHMSKKCVTRDTPEKKCALRRMSPVWRKRETYFESFSILKKKIFEIFSILKKKQYFENNKNILRFFRFWKNIYIYIFSITKIYIYIFWTFFDFEKKNILRFFDFEKKIYIYIRFWKNKYKINFFCFPFQKYVW